MKSDLYLNPEIRVDMHIHTEASDGTWTPQSLIKECKNINIEMLSVTDHDSVSNIENMITLSEICGIYFIPGVEISSTYENKLFHILAYGISRNNIALQRMLSSNTHLLQKKDDDSILTLINEGYNIDFEEYLSYKNDSSRGGWKTLNFLIDKGFCKDTNDFFGNLFTGKLKIPFPIFPHPKTVIQIIKEAGGTPILAHPGSTLVNKDIEIIKVLDQFKVFGIEGIECYHISHDEKTVAYCKEWCLKNDMQITGGSDSHGNLIKERSLGFPKIQLKDIYIDKILNSV